jgi:protein-disulfide isomerase
MEAEKAKEGAENDKKSERTENIVALAVFAFLILLGIALFTGGFGLFNRSNSAVDSSQRVKVPLGDDPITDAKNPKVLIVAFSDYECPFCGKAEPIIKDILAKYPAQVAYIFKDSPLVDIHPYAFGAAMAAECAKEQGKYWEYHDTLFAHQDQLTVDNLKGYAQDLGLNMTSFNFCLDTQKYKAHVENDMATARQVGVTGTPTFFINGIKVIGAQPESTFIDIINSEINAKK